MGKKLFTVLLILAVFFVCVFLYLSYTDLLNNYPAYESAGKAPFNRTGNGFNLTPKLQPNLKKTVDIYVPEYEVTEFETANFYAARFGMSGADILSGEDEYIFAKGDEKLTVYRNIKLIEYENTKKIRDTAITKDEARVRAGEILSLKQLQVLPDEIKVNADGEKYTVTFADTLAGVTNLAFPQTVVMDGFGNVEKITYYSVKYKKIGQSKLKTAEDAFAEYLHLFVNSKQEENRTEQPVKSFIQGADIRLIYIYQDSIVQAGYLLERETETGETEEIKVAASKF
ncbi:MAG: hypothetical protein LBS21_15090 [Clostridiales bacterium]|jgi:hypothetical protein|nr:hypothetical protein [Clostridiales bacterium]